MTTPAPAGDDRPPLTDWLQIDAACDRFEAAWHAGQPPTLASVLDQVAAPLRPRLLRELLGLELEFRHQRGETPEPADYHAQFPDQTAVIAAVFATLGRGPCLSSVPSQEPLRSPSAPQETELGSELPRAGLSVAAVAALRAAGYEILGELGRGGMGVVYLARTLALNRPCALKMILAGVHASAAATARFHAEAEAIARLRHAEIVQIYHVGTADGLPYLELEYLPGGSLDRTLDGTPRPPAAAAQLVAILAGAIAEAHRQGIVHRDLKPANILLDSRGRPKVADFGLAKMLDSDDGLTKSCAVLGSPSYMAPEQAAGQAKQIGPAADVYALGAILYELLTGRPPFRAATALETLAQVKSAEPVRPSQFQPGLARDLETICLKCLAKEPGRRYATAAALGEDLERYLNGEPIVARPAPVWERWWKWSRRRPTLAAALAVSATAVAVLLGGAWYYNTRLHNALGQATMAEQAAYKQRDLALSAFKNLVFDVQEKLEETPTTRPLRQKLLAKALRGLDKIAKTAEVATPNLSRAVAHQKLGNIFRQIGRTQEAVHHYDQARVLAERLIAESPENIATAECLRDTYHGIADIDMKIGRFDEANQAAHRAIELSEWMVAVDPARSGVRRGLIDGYALLGDVQGWKGTLAGAEAPYQKMLALAEDWVAAEPDNRQAKMRLARSYFQVGNLRVANKKFTTAKRHFKRVLALLNQLLATDPNDRDAKSMLPLTIANLFEVAYGLHDLEEVRRLAAQAEPLMTEAADADLDNVNYQFQLLYFQAELAVVEMEDLRFDRALLVLFRLRDRVERLHRDGRANLHDNDIYKFQVEVQIPFCEAAPRALENLAFARSRPPRLASRLLSWRARTLAERGRWLEAVASVEAVLDLQTAADDRQAELARQLTGLIGDLDGPRWSGLPAPERQRLRARLVDRSLTALECAVVGGFRDIKINEHDAWLEPLRDEPRYRRLLERITGTEPPAN
jgi:serine/threonine protein kinase/tetratricopeptide (TPR) repeat protein